MMIYRWLDAPTEVNAYYTAQFNQFGKEHAMYIHTRGIYFGTSTLTVILAGILRPPFYAANWSP